MKSHSQRVMDRIFGMWAVLLLAGCNLNSPDTPTPSPTATELPPIAIITETPSEPSPTPIQEIVLTDISTPLPTLSLETPLPAANASIPALDATLATFDFNAPIQFAEASVQGGQILIIAYTVTVENPGRGAVFFDVVDNNGEVVGRFLVTESAVDEFDVPIAASGTYSIRAATSNLEGNFSIAFSTRES